MTRSLSLMESAEVSKDSAQSPAWSKNASPRETAASCFVRLRASPANTKGGNSESSPKTFCKELESGHIGCWLAVKLFHELGCQSELLSIFKLFPMYKVYGINEG